MRTAAVCVLFLLFVSVPAAVGQIDSVAVYLQRIKAEPEDSLRLRYAENVQDFLQRTEFGSYRTEAPVQYLGYKKTADGDMELYSWVVPLQVGQAFYNFFRLKTGQVYRIKSLPGAENPEGNWLFYDLLPFSHRKQDYVALFGWGQTRNSNRKAVLIAQFGPEGAISYNHPLMRKGKSRSASLTFEYAKDGSMMLKHDRRGKRIIFDHLAPVDKKYEGYFMFYGPDASYDALELKNGEWWYEENVKQ